MKAMQRWLACILTVLMLFGSVALGEGAEADLQKDTLVVGSTTPLSGMFFGTMWGYNTTDMDVRLLLHGYGTVALTEGHDYIIDPTVVAELDESRSGYGPKTYTFTLADGLAWNDGTPITAQDYVFSVLLKSSPMVAALGGVNTQYGQMTGYADYAAGEKATFAGVRLIDEKRFSLTVEAKYLDYFYETSFVDVQPAPIHVIAPECAVKDDGEGAYVDGPFTQELLAATLLDPATGYVFRPMVTCGPYSLEDVDLTANTAAFVRNEKYAGNYEGVKPQIERVRIVPVTNANMQDKVAAGEVDVLHKISRVENIEAAMDKAANGQGNAVKYLRSGYGFLSFACEQGPTQYASVRKAISYCLDKNELMDSFGGEYALRVYGCYGYGQWMPTYTDATLNVYEELRGFPRYDIDLDRVDLLLDRDGWTLDENHNPYVPGEGKIRHKAENGKLMPLTIRFAKAEGNETADKIVELLKDNFAVSGIGLEVTELPFDEMLKHYYRQTDREFDMFYLATNFDYVFDPYYMYNVADEYQGVLNTSGLRNSDLMELARRMRKVAPGDKAEYVRRWLDFQHLWAELLPAAPLYSNVYVDYTPANLKDWRVDSFSSWALTMPYAHFE